MNIKVIKEENEGEISNNTDLMQKTDINESINEVLRAHIESKESEDILSDDLRDKKLLTKDKEAIINSETNDEESDYFNLLLEKIGF